MMNKFYMLLVTLFLAFASDLYGASLSNQQQVTDCDFDKKSDWWLRRFGDLPTNVDDNDKTHEPEFCEFYQFTQDYFLYLISPSQLSTTNEDNWQDQRQFPVLETAGQNSCDDQFTAHSFNVRMAKDPNDAKDFVLPERTDQAGHSAGSGTIYDQQGNVVFYEIRFSKNLCDIEKIQANDNFPGKTIEMKMAWQILDDVDDKSSYYQTMATINGTSYQLGLIGWHIIIAADNHPEFVWATIEHNGSAALCENLGKDNQGYSFTAKSCANDDKCSNLNNTQKYQGVHLPSDSKANDICTVFPYGTVFTDNINTRDGLNIALIDKLNASLNELFTDSPFSIWKNYRVAGALWVSDINQNSGSASGSNTNQRGSLELANTFMETSDMGKIGQAGSATNCFVCHRYSAKGNNTANNTLSHIIDDIANGLKINKKSNSVK